MDRDASRMRRGKPFVFTNVKTGHNVADVVRFIEAAGGLGA